MHSLNTFNDWLPVIFAAVMGLAILAYVILDGYDLGVGILMRGQSDEHQDIMIGSIGPFWDANETWLVLGIGILLTAFPFAHGVILTALYLPVAIMLLGLILRGVAFDFRAKANADHKHAWNITFYAGSLIATLAQGYMLGAYIVGFEKTWAALLFGVLIAPGLVAGYALGRKLAADENRRRAATQSRQVGAQELVVDGRWRGRGVGGHALGEPRDFRQMVQPALCRAARTNSAGHLGAVRGDRPRAAPAADGKRPPVLATLCHQHRHLCPGVFWLGVQPVSVSGGGAHHHLGRSQRPRIAQDHSGRRARGAADDYWLHNLCVQDLSRQGDGAAVRLNRPMRRFHAPFEPFWPEKAHGYCAFYFEKSLLFRRRNPLMHRGITQPYAQFLFQPRVLKPPAFAHETPQHRRDGGFQLGGGEARRGR
jgi:GNAT superfamily N-acetyltransferase